MFIELPGSSVWIIKERLFRGPRKNLIHNVYVPLKIRLNTGTYCYRWYCYKCLREANIMKKIFKWADTIYLRLMLWIVGSIILMFETIIYKPICCFFFFISNQILLMSSIIFKQLMLRTKKLQAVERIWWKMTGIITIIFTTIVMWIRGCSSVTCYSKLKKTKYA